MAFHFRHGEITGSLNSGVRGLNTKELTFSFFPRLNFPSDTKILLLYPTVPYLIFKFISLGNM